MPSNFTNPHYTRIEAVPGEGGIGGDAFVCYRAFGYNIGSMNAGKDGGTAISDHPNKQIREAVDYALDQGWRLRKAGPRAHIWGLLFCPRADRDGCRLAVLSTPRVPEHHARQIRRVVARCPHRQE